MKGKRNDAYASYSFTMQYNSAEDCLSVCTMMSQCESVNYGSFNNVTFICEIFEAQQVINLEIADDWWFFGSVGKLQGPCTTMYSN